MSEIIIYCLGAAIQRGILLALQLCEEHVAFEIETTTFSTELIGKFVKYFITNVTVNLLFR